MGSKAPEGPPPGAKPAIPPAPPRLHPQQNEVDLAEERDTYRRAADYWWAAYYQATTGRIPQPASSDPEQDRAIRAVGVREHDRSQFMRDALVALSGVVCTPAKGYEKDGGYGLLLSDMLAMRRKYLDLVQKLDFLKSKGITVGILKDQNGERLSYMIEPGSELCDLETLDKLTNAELARDAAITAIGGALQAHDQADNQRLIEHGEAVQEAEKWKSEGDMYGWNFHMGKAGGMTTASIIFARVRRVLEQLLERFPQRGDSATARQTK